MAELKFCLKAFVSSVLIVLALQIHVGGRSLELHAHDWLEQSQVAQYLEKVAIGATLAIKNSVKYVTQMSNQAFGSPEAQKEAHIETSRASRLNLEFQRSPAATKNQKNKDN